MPKQLTIRGVPDEVADRLRKLSHEHGTSVNHMVLEILARAVGFEERRAKFERYVTWTDEDLAAFNKVLAEQRVIDDKLWR